MDLDALATQNAVYLFAPDILDDDGGFKWHIPFTEIADIEIGKEWFDWYVRIHTSTGEPSARFNLGSNQQLAERLRTYLHAAMKRATEAASVT